MLCYKNISYYNINEQKNDKCDFFKKQVSQYIKQSYFKMKKTILVVLLLSFSVFTFAQKKPKIKGNRIVTEITKDVLESFNIIEIDDALKVELNQSNENTYFLKTDENLIDIIQFNVKDSILKIYTTNKIVKSKKLKIVLNVKDLEYLILKNNALIKTKGKLSSDKLNISAYNSSYFDLDIKADDVNLSLYNNAGGKIKTKSKNTTIIMNDRTNLKGYIISNKTNVTLTKYAELKLDGDSDNAIFNTEDSSRLDAKKMKISSVSLNSSNKTDVYVYASKNLELYAKGKSKVYVYGNANMDVKGLADKSKIIKK